MERKEVKSAAGSLGEFIERYKNAIIAVVVIIAVAIIAVVVVHNVSDASIEKGLTNLDSLTVEYGKAQANETVDEAVVADILSRAKVLAEKSSGIVAVRSFMFAADIDFNNQNWEYSKESWLKAAQAKKAYTTAVCYYNAAICSEEMGDFEDAIAYLKEAANDTTFVLSPRALFNAARIEEQNDKFSDAQLTYQSLNDSYAGSEWSKLAKTRLISLKSDGKIN